MLDKVAIGAIVSTAVLVLGLFGITIPPEIEVEIVAVVVGIITIVTYFTTSYVVVERKKNVDKLKTK
jgi:quinol-cytochrome oxidoreductase complex cytochrome b subunit